MVTIIIEGVLFVTLLATMGVLVVRGVQHTPLGRWVRQTNNRRRIERAAARRFGDGADVTRCLAHGSFGERDLVRLPGGARICPDCYAEIVDGSH
jgi:hypothetical protein